MDKVNKHFVTCLSLLAVSVFIGWKPVVQTFALSWSNDEYTQILLILPVSIVLMLLERQYLERTRDWNLRLGALIGAIAIAIASSTRFLSVSLSNDEQLSIWMFALVLSWIGIFVICLGRHACSRLVFPLLFLFGLVPLPKGVLDNVIGFLQQGSACSAHALFALFNVPVLQQGVQLSIPGLTIEVAKQCSSIRSSSMLVVTSLVTAQVLLRSPWRKAFIVALAVPLSIAKNGLRVFTIAMLGTRVNPGYLTGRFHHQGGILFFLIALVVEVVIILLLRRWEQTSATRCVELLSGTAATN